MSLDVWLYMEVDTGGQEPECVELFDANITHNLGGMADRAGIYKALWHPDEEGYKLAGDIIGVVECGLALMKEDPDGYKEFDAPNGWGLYEHFVPWVERYLEACKAHPKAMIGVWR